MSRRSDNEHSSFDWQTFEKKMRSDLSQLHTTVNRLPGGDWIEKFVNNALNRSLGRASGMFGAEPSNVELFETSKLVIAKVKVPKRTNPADIRLYVGADEARLEWPDNNAKVLKLPAPVNSQKCKAEIRGGTLEIFMPKQKRRRRMKREIYISY